MVDNTSKPNIYKGFVYTNSDNVIQPKSKTTWYPNVFLSNHNQNSQNATCPLKSEIKSYLVDLYKQGYSIDNIYEMANSFGLWNADIDDNGNFFIIEAPNENSLSDIYTYNKEGKLISKQNKICWGGEFYDYTQNENGEIKISKGSYDYYFKDFETFNNNQPTIVNLREKGFVKSSTVYEYRRDGVMKSENGKKSFIIPDKSGDIVLTKDKANKNKIRKNENVYEYDSTGKLTDIHLDGAYVALDDNIIEYNERFSNTYVFDKNGDLLNYKVGYKTNPDGIITKDCRNIQNVGDCYLLAALNTILQLKDGAAILSNLITTHKDGSCEVTFPGKTPDGTSSFKFTQDEVFNITYRSDLSTGDTDIKLIEAAYEKSLNNVGRSLAGGSDLELYKAIFPRVGKNLNVPPNNLVSLVINETPEIIDKNVYYSDNFALSNKTLDELYTEYKSDNTEKSNMLYWLKVLKDSEPGKYAVSCSIAFDGGTGHAISIKEVTNKEVVIIDSNLGTSTISIPIETFVNSAQHIALIENMNNVDKINHNQIKLFNYLQLEIGNAPKWEDKF